MAGARLVARSVSGPTRCAPRPPEAIGGLVSWDGISAKAMASHADGRSYEDPYLAPIYGDFAASRRPT
jgi:hypothetical protein